MSATTMSATGARRPWRRTLVIWGLRAGFIVALMGIAWFESVTAIIFSVVLLSGFFCAIACPWGTLSDAISLVGRAVLGRRRRRFAIPQRWHRLLGPARWVILAEVIAVVAADPALR